MDIKLDKKKNSNLKKYNFDELDIAIQFSKYANKEMKEMLKGIVLFGSAARAMNKRDANAKVGDIDLLMILDDISMKLNKELIEVYKVVCQKIVNKVSPRIHITTLKFTTFWDMVRNCDPVAINILRDGMPILDSGFFEPLQALLLRGRVRPTYESIWTYYTRADNTLKNSKRHIVSSIIDLYWSGIDAAHSALMKLGTLPPAPEFVADIMEEKMLKKKFCNKNDIRLIRELYHMNKEIESGVLTNLSGQEYDKLYARTSLFVENMKRIVRHVQ